MGGKGGSEVTHRHDWRLVSPIDPESDSGNLAARIAATNIKNVHYGCDCGAVKMELWTDRRRNLYITTSTGRLWRGRYRVRGAR